MAVDKQLFWFVHRIDEVRKHLGIHTDGFMLLAWDMNLAYHVIGIPSVTDPLFRPLSD